MKTNKTEATERPWTVDSNEIRCSSGVLAECHGQVCIEEEWHPSIEAKANAALIVKAVNEYSALCAVAEAAGSVAMASHNIKTAIERFGEAGGFKQALDDKNKVLLDALSALAALRSKEWK